ncbi:hypothetical protein AAK938_07530 [Aerococcaceae bacterium 50-4]
MEARIQKPNLVPVLEMTDSLSYSTSYNSDIEPKIRFNVNSLEHKINNPSSKAFINKQILEDDITNFIKSVLDKDISFKLNIYEEDEEFIYVNLKANKNNAVEIFNFATELNNEANNNDKNFIFVVGE